MAQNREARNRAAEYAGRVAYLSGAGSGIGAETARLLAARGAAVAVGDIDRDRAESVAAGIRADGGQAIALEIDVARAEDSERAIADTLAAFGRLDWAVNNAGIAGQHSLIVDSDPAQWAAVIQVNLLGTYYALRAQLRHFREAPHGGAIVNTGSITSVNGQSHTAGYNSSKHGVAGLTKTAALEGASDGVRVNAVAPGYVRTPLLDMLDDEQWRGIAALHPIGRVAEPGEIARTIAFLLSDESSFTTGAIALVDGGYSAL